MLALISAAIEDPSDLEFMTQFYLQYERLMYATVMKRLSDPETAKDIVQDCVVKLIPKIPFLRQQKRCINASCGHETRKRWRPRPVSAILNGEEECP